MLFSLACTACDWRGSDADLSACPVCSATLDVRYETSAIPINEQLPGLWRYAAHLPVHDLSSTISLGEGNTPLLRSAHVGAAIGLPDLYSKMEGANPTGSYKDRIAAVGITRLRELGKTAW